MHNHWVLWGFFLIVLNMKAFAVGKCSKVRQPRNVALHTCHIQVVGHCESTSQGVNRHEVVGEEKIDMK